MRRLNPAAAPAPGGSWQRLTLAVAVDGQTEFALPIAPGADEDGDPLCRVEYGGGTYGAPADFEVDGTALRWTADIPLSAGEELVVWFAPEGA